jgi:hypothetical protein
VDYTALVSTLKAYTENSFPDTSGTGGLTTAQQLNTFIEQAEQRIYNTVQLLDLRKNVVGACSANNKYLTVPTDWLANFSMAVIDPVSGDYEYLLNKDVNFIRAAYPNPADSGIPAYYAMFDQNSYLLGPTPDIAYNIELHYFYYPESIVTAGTSWLGDNFDSVLLYGALLEAYTYMKGEEDVIAGYQKRYDESLAMLKQYGEGKNRQDMYRTPQVRYPVR